MNLARGVARSAARAGAQRTFRPSRRPGTELEDEVSRNIDRDHGCRRRHKEDATFVGYNWAFRLHLPLLCNELGLEYRDTSVEILGAEMCPRRIDPS